MKIKELKDQIKTKEKELNILKKKIKNNNKEKYIPDIDLYSIWKKESFDKGKDLADYVSKMNYQKRKEKTLEMKIKRLDLLIEKTKTQLK